MVDGELGQSAESPTKAILLQSPGRKPWVNRRNTFIEPCKGGTTPRQTLAPKVPLLRSSYFLCPWFTQGFISGVALITPWALKKYRAYGTHASTTQQIQQQTQTTTPNND